MARWRLGLRGALHADGRLIDPAVLDVAAGRIVSVERSDRADVTLDGVLLPALINAHSHLDLAGGGNLPARGSFTDWLLGVGSVRGDARDIDSHAFAEARQQARRGVVAVGDIDASGGTAARARARAGLHGPSFLEIVGVSPDSARRRLADALALAERLGGPAEVGLSPHAPYSVAASVLPEIARAARRAGRPLAMHLAETEEETRYLLHGDGPFQDFLRTIGRGLPFAKPPGCRPIALAAQTGLLAAGCLVVHGNDLDSEDIACLAAHGSSVVYCHGTHSHFERPPHPLAELLAAGVNVSLGTDSALSNTGIDPWGELRRLAVERPDVDPLLLLRCATLGGRIALRLERGPATFESGATADALIVGPAPAQLADNNARGLLAALFADAEPWLTLQAGRLRPAPGHAPASVTALLDTVTGHG